MENIDQKLDNIYRLTGENRRHIVEIKTLLVGMEGESNGGLCRRVTNIEKTQSRLLWIMVGILASAALGGGIAKLVLG